MKRGVPFELEMRARLKDRQYRWFLVQYKPLIDGDGRVVRWYATGTDINGRKRAEEQINNENLALREEISRASMFEEIVGSSDAVRNVLQQVAKVAPTDSTVLITGETGTGKEPIARAIHRRSARSTRAFVTVNCAAVPPSLIASELFGHERGAFTGDRASSSSPTAGPSFSTRSASCLRTRRLAEDDVVSCAREDRSELAAHQS
jgi:formate hydrogenlyase transcriptional activator